MAKTEKEESEIESVSEDTSETSLTTFSRMLQELTPIRVEAVMTKFPLHKISANEPDEITIVDPENQDVMWRVLHRPGIGAYKFHTLIMNREIERLGRPVPPLLPLGSLRKIAEELGLGRNTNFVKSIIEQNSWAVITPKITYTAQNGKKRSLEKQFTICKAVYFSGDILPNGEESTQVVLEFNDEYLSLLNTARTRPLDYAYLKILTPKEQRWYELVSFSIYSALQREDEFAVVRYSDFCRYAPQTKYSKPKEVQKQMARLHKTHISSGYLKKASIHLIKSIGEPDWEIRYYPGEKARAEYSEAARGHANKLPAQKPNLNAEEKIQLNLKGENTEIIEKPYDRTYDSLLELKVNPNSAKNLITSDPEEVKYQLSIFDKNKVYKDSPAAYLVWAIKNKFRPADAPALENAYDQPKLFEKGIVEEPPLPRVFTDEPCVVCYGGKMQIIKGRGARPCRFCVNENNVSTGKLPLEYDEFLLDEIINATE